MALSQQRPTQPLLVAIAEAERLHTVAVEGAVLRINRLPRRSEPLGARAHQRQQ